MTAANLQELIIWAVSTLEASDVDSALLDAEVLLARTLGVDRSYLLAHNDLVPDPAQTSRFRALIKRRAQRQPLAYLTGRRWFYGLEFIVSPAVLIPRPETELLIELAGDWLSGHVDSATTVADIGTGSGAIAVALAAQSAVAAQSTTAARRAETIHIFATDLSDEALAVALQNAERHHVLHRITFVQGDLLEPINTPVDLILSNPPYISTSDLPGLMPEVRAYEPPAALDGGPDGLQVVERLLSQAQQKLNPGGALFIEIGYDQGERAQALACHYFPDASISVQQDLAGLDRVLAIALS